ncbi:MAG: 4a-hydroxytetrahydrobiopterin dehydratase [Bacteroidota bacterium]
MLPLRERKCKPLEQSAQPFDEEKIREYKEMLQPGWEVVNNNMLKKRFIFNDFGRAMAFVQEIAGEAEQEQHHPDMCIRYSDVEVELSTRNIGGLSENDFIMAAKIDSF